MKVGDELVTVLTRVTTEHASGRWQSLRLALLTVWKKEKIGKLANLLGGYRQELTLRCVTILNAKIDIHSSRLAERLDTLQQSNEEIKELFLITHSILEKAPSSQNQILQNQQLPIKQAGDEDQCFKHFFANDNFPNDEKAQSRLAASKHQREPHAKLRHALGEMAQAPGPKITKRSRSNDHSSDDDEFFKGRPMKKLSINGPGGTSKTRC
jgi:hypothetical protein